MASKGTKTLRKSRRPRINFGATRGGPQFEPNEQSRKEFEKALGCEIPEPVRTALTEIVQSYFDSHSIETEAPFADEAQDYNAEIRTRALALRETLRNQGPTEKSVRLILGRKMNILGVKPGIPQLDWIEKGLTSLVRGTSHTKEYFATSGSFEGDPWELMIREIRELFRSNRLPHTASQDTSKNKAGRRSKFVEFIEALQKTFPPPIGRHYGISATSLAKQINRASRAGGKKRDISAVKRSG
jgi:hypothetical protein